MEEKLRPIIKDYAIINIKEILEVIRKCDDESLLSIYYEEANEYNPGKEIKGLSELIAALSIHLEEIAKSRAENKNVLNKLLEQNPNLTGLSLIETKKEKNDSNVDIDYLKYSDENGKILLLECKNSEALSELLSENAEAALYGSAKEIFDYFNKYKYPQMEFFNLYDEQFREKQLAKVNADNPRITNASFTEEQNIIADYRKRKGIEVDVKVAINNYGERIYILDSLVIKFRDNDNKRKMEIISDPLKNLELEKEELNTLSASNFLYQSTKDEPTNLLSITKSNNLISKLYKGNTLSVEELNNLHAFILAGLNKMKETELHYDYQNTIDIYIVYLENKSNLKQLSKEENNLLREYQNIIRTREEKITNSEFLTQNNQKTLKLIPKNLNTNGAIITVAILETTILLGILISVLALVKR